MLNKLMSAFVAKKPATVSIPVSAPVTPDQMQFDLTVGAPIEGPVYKAPVEEPVYKAPSIEVPVYEAPSIPESVIKENKIEEEKKMTTVNKTLVMEVKEQLLAAGIDPSDTAAVSAYMITNAWTLKALAEKHAETPVSKAKEVQRLPQFDHKLHLEFEALVRKAEMYGDIHINANLKIFAMDSRQRVFSESVWAFFENDIKKIGDYFRKVLGINEVHEFAKTSAFVTADISRSAGDLLETGITKIAQALNKYVFHTAATIIEAPVGGRPEVLKEFNYVNDAAATAYNKAKTAMPKKKEKKAVKPATN